MGKRALTSSVLDDEAVIAFFTTRELPLKAGERKDLKEKVEKNKKFVAKWLNIPINNLIIPIQTHSDNVEVVDLKKSEYPDCDALMTNKKNIAIALNFADCVPIIFYEPVSKVIAVAHAGWRGTVAKIAVKTIQKMKTEFNCKAKNIIAAIGPAIDKCCFEVGEDVLEKLLSTIKEEERKFVFDEKNVDLKSVNKFQILASGVTKIDLCEDCTCCNSELFFSYRGENGHTARHSAIIMLK